MFEVFVMLLAILLSVFVLVGSFVCFLFLFTRTEDE